MECIECGGSVIWRGPLSNLTHTQCQQCGALNSQILDSEEVQCECCDNWGEPNYEGNTYFCGGSERCCP